MNYVFEEFVITEEASVDRKVPESELPLYNVRGKEVC